MLVITRKEGESLTIGDDIEVTVLEINGSSMRLGIKAPIDFDIKRDNMKKGIILEEEEQDEQEVAGRLFKWGLAQSVRG